MGPGLATPLPLCNYIEALCLAGVQTIAGSHNLSAHVCTGIASQECALVCGAVAHDQHPL